MPAYKCDYCGESFTARAADRARGWARFCSKSCKAKKQEKRTGQYRKLLTTRAPANLDDEDPSWDSHKTGF